MDTPPGHDPPWRSRTPGAAIGSARRWFATVAVALAAAAGFVLGEPPEQTTRIDQANLELAARIAVLEESADRWHAATQTERELREARERTNRERRAAARRFHRIAVAVAADPRSVALDRGGLTVGTARPQDVAEQRTAYEGLTQRAARIYVAHGRQQERQASAGRRHNQAALVAARAEQQTQRLQGYTERASYSQLALEQVRTLAHPPDPHPDPPLEWPVRGAVVSGYGLRAWPDFGRMHPGVDIVNLPGAPIRAAADGVVVGVQSHVSRGNAVIIDHGEQVQHPGRWRTVYSHLADMSVQHGQVVRAGEPVGTLGNTGRQTTGPHLHFEVRIEDQAVDPRRWLP